MAEPKTRLPDSRVTPRFAGLCSFGRYPLLTDLPDVSTLDWAIYGVPYDSGVTYRPGARFGPRSIREQSQYLKRYHLEHGVDVCEVLSLADAGDAPAPPYHPKQALDGVIAFADALPTNARLLALGGDHSIAYANIMATWRRLGSPDEGLAVLHLDSHLDTVDEVWGEKYSHASPFVRLVEAGAIDPRFMMSIGIKGPLNAAADLDYGHDAGINVVTYDDWKLKDGDRRIRDFVRRLERRPTYITFDIDCIDPAYAPGTGTPSVGGFTSAEALILLRSFAGVNVAGADVVEVLPDRDVAGNTALLAAHVAFEILALDAISDR